MNPSSAVDVVTGSFQLQLQTQQATAAIVQELLLKINASGLSARSLLREHTADDVIDCANRLAIDKPAALAQRGILNAALPGGIHTRLRCRFVSDLVS